MTVSSSASKPPRSVLRNLFALGFLFQAAVAGAQNLATNPGFETGGTTGWFGFGSPTISAQTVQVHSGTYAALVTNRTASYMGIAQSLQNVLTNNQTYTISAWVRLAGGANQTVQLTIQKVDGGGTGYATVASGSASTNGWLQLSGSYTLNYSGSLTSLTLYAEVPSSANAAYYLDDLSVQPPIAPSTNGQCTVDWTNVFQRIDGFGASSAYRGTWTASQANMFFSTNNGTGTTLDGRTNYSFTGIGLSLLRSKITYNNSINSTTTPGSYETSIMQMAQSRGALVWSAPWTPPRGFKDSGATNGGNYLGNGNNATNLAYASQLANYVASMKNTYGVNLYALSVQNEPNYNTTSYESCIWSDIQIRDFVTNLYSALAAKGVGSTKIIIPESESWSSGPGLYAATLNDATAAAEVSIIANHNYVNDNVAGDTTPPAALSTSGKASWETEVSQLGGDFDGSMTNAVYWAGRVHLFMTAAQANAWHFWWLVAFNGGNEGLTDTNGIPAKRMYALGNFARFVRPNFYRINVGGNTGTAQISAYKDSVSPGFAIVAVNSGPTTLAQTFNLTNGLYLSSVTPWLTTSNLNLASQAAVLVTNASFIYPLPPLSVVTFVGQADLPPTNIFLSGVSVPENRPAGTAVGVLSTADPDPGNTFTYALVNGTGGADNSKFTVTGNILSTAAIFDAAVQNTFAVRIRSTDQNGLWFEKPFTITATPDSQARKVVNVALAPDGNWTVSFAGIPGYAYRVQAAADLKPPVFWVNLTNNNSGGILFTADSSGLWLHVDLNSTNYPGRFYRTVEP